MTVCFTDLGNFTPLTFRLKEATVPLLNRIFGVMVPAIRRNNGYVNKFLGDGVMFFFGAPRENPAHASDALRAILDIQHAMREINDELTTRGLPNITLRAGVNSGSMVVGDAGSEMASDYTVLGDDVNLASRMESANKQLGTTALVSARTVELAGEDGLLLRPIGQISVVGREEPVLTYEILATKADATDEQKRLAELTRAMVDAFREARLEDCLRRCDDMDRAFGPSKLTALYRERIEHFRGDASAMADFNCTIVLSEK
jgi:adenylate cyclase